MRRESLQRELRAMRWMERIFAIRDHHAVKRASLADVRRCRSHWVLDVLQAIRCDDHVETMWNFAIGRMDKLVTRSPAPRLGDSSNGEVQSSDVAAREFLRECSHSLAEGTSPIKNVKLRRT